MTLCGVTGLSVHLCGYRVFVHEDCSEWSQTDSECENGVPLGPVLQARMQLHAMWCHTLVMCCAFSFVPTPGQEWLASADVCRDKFQVCVSMRVGLSDRQ